MVIVLELIAGPPYGILGILVHNDELILRRTSGVDTGHYVNRAKLGLLALLKALKTRIGLSYEQFLKRRVVDDFLCIHNAILR